MEEYDYQISKLILKKSKFDSYFSTKKMGCWLFYTIGVTYK